MTLWPASCCDLLRTLGFEPTRGDGLIDGAVDFDAWERSPDSAMGLAQVLPAAHTVEQIYRVTSKLDIEQGWFEKQFGPPREYVGPSEVSGLVAQLWNLYLAGGREQLLTSGTLTIARPRFHPRAIGDLVIGKTLVDVKAKNNPLSDLDKDFVQLLRYVLFDQDDTYRFAAVTLYCGYHGIVLEHALPPVLDLLAMESALNLEQLRRDVARLRLAG